MNFYDVLAAEKWGGGIPTINFFDLLFAQSISGEQWQIYEGTLPATINANGADLRQYQVWGNTGGVGDKTVNLFDGTYTKGFVGTTYIYKNTGTSANSAIIPCKPSTTYAIKKYDKSDRFAIGTSNVLPYNEIQLTGVYYVDTATEYTFTTDSSAHYIVVYISTGTEQAEPRLMALKGSTAPASFVPFGYKLDMVSRTDNLYDKNNDSMNFLGYVNNITYVVVASSRDSFSIIVPVEPNTTYTIVKPETSRFRVGLFTSYPYAGEVATNIYGDRDGNGIDHGTSLTFNTSNNTSYILAFIRNYDDSGATNDQMKNSTVVFKGLITPIYIGDEPLDKDEYIDYQAGKIYRYETEMKKDVSQTGWTWRWETDDVTYQATLSNRVSVGRFYPEDTKEYIISAVPDTFEVAVISADSSDVKIADTGWGASWTLSGASAHSFCVTVRKSDNSDITPSEVDGVKFKVTSSLTPTDPPVTLPALPTVDGTTIVDYAGQSVAPEKVYLEYQGGK